MAFEVNKAPKLEGADRKDLMKFLEDYMTYLEVFEREIFLRRARLRSFPRRVRLTGSCPFLP